MAKNWWEEQPKPTGSLASLQPTTQPPSAPAFDSAANNPYATQLAQGLQAYRNRPNRFSTEQASLPAPAPPPEADKPAFDLGNSLSALYEGATEQFIPGVKSALAQAYTGLERPDRNPEWATRFMEEGRQAQQQADQRTAELQRQGQSDSTSEAIRSAIPSLGFSLGSMAAAIPAGLAGAAATQAAIPIPGSGLVGGALAAGAASGVAGYRMAGSQFLNDTFAQMEQESQKQRGRGLTEQEKATAYQELRPVAENTGLWEAGPEAIGNAAMLGLGRVALGLMPKAAMQNLAASALGRAGVRTGAAAGALATEVGTEGVTQFAQGNDQQKGQAAVDALLSGKDMKTAMAAVDPQYQGFQGLVQSTKDVAPATIATVLLMGGLAKPGHMAYSALQERAETNRRGEQTDEILANTQPFRAALDRADAADLSQVLSAFNQIREAGKIPKSAMERLDSAQSAVEAELTRKQAIESQVAADTGQQGAPVPSDFLGPANADPLADQIAAEDRRAQQSADFNANPRSIGSLLNDWNQRESMRAGAVQGGIAADRARLSEIAQQQLERQRQETLSDRTQAIQQQEADRRARLNAEIATRGAPGELARLLGPDTQLPSPRQEAPAPQSLSDLLNRPSQSSAVPTSRAGERGSLRDLFPQNRNWWDTELSPSATTESPAPPKSGWTRFGNETGTLNIPRAEMPQVKAEHRGALVNFLNARGVAHEADTEVDPATLKPTQAEFSPQKVRKAINYQGGDRSILVSGDGYVLDGHHQWLAALEQGKPIKAIRLDAPIANLLPLTREFPSSTVSTASNVRGGQTGRVETPTTAAPTQPETPSNETRKAEAEAAPLLNQAPVNPYRSPEDRDAAIGRLEEAARTHDKRAVRERAAVIGDAVRMGATEEELRTAIDAGDGDAIEAIADRQYQKTGGILLGFGQGKTEKPPTNPKSPHPVYDHENWKKLTDRQVQAFAKAAKVKPDKDRLVTLRRIDDKGLPISELQKAWDDAMTAADQPTLSLKVVRREQISDATIRHYLSNGMFVDEEAVKSGQPMKFMVYAPGQGPRGIALAIGSGKTLKEAISKAAAGQPTKKKPTDLILWGYKPGTSDAPIKLGPFSKAEQSRREKDGWKTAAYAKGDEPTGLREQAKKEAAKAPAPPTPNRQRQQVVTASGRKIDTEFEVVELDDLITSDKAEFPKALQPRDRSRLSSANQVMTIAGKMDPQQLADSRLASDGAPVIGPDNVVESGNGRTMALREVYGRERLKDRADAYRAMIEAKGFDVAGMNQPVLVRRRITTLTDQERKAFTEEANARNTLGMSPAERAMVHAGRMDATLLDLYKGGDLTTLANSDFVRGFMSEVAPDEAAEIRTADGLLNQEGIRRIEAAILAKAYPDSALLGTLLESTDNNIKAIGGALLDSAPAMAGMKGKIAQGLILPETDISAEVVEAARLVAKARREGKLLSELLAQSGMFGDNVSPLAQRIVRLFFADADFKRQISRDKIAGLLNTYAELAKNIKPGDALFDDLPALTVGDVIGALEKKNREPEKQQQPALFGGNPARPSGTTGGRETQRPDAGAPGAAAGAAEQGQSQEDDLGAIFDQELEKAFANAPSTGEVVERDRESDQTENGVGTENVPTQRAGIGRRARNASRTDEGGGAPEQGDSGVSNAPSAVPGAKRPGGISAKDGTVRPQRGATGSGDSGRGGQPGSERIRSARGTASRSSRTAKAADAGVKAGQAAVEVGQGLKATMDGLAALFGGKGKLSSGLTFDEETYQQAVPFFKDAVRHFKEAAKDAREAIRLLIQAMMGGGYDKAVIASMKPYAIRFVTDVRNGVIDLTETEPHAEPETMEPARVDYTAKRDAQRAAESVAVKAGDIDNIRATLPYLLPEQQNDVLKAEQRFERNNGILFTNATGTGKTYTGLGVIKRMVKMGKENILIVVPSQTKAQDWVDDGKNLGLDITVLPDTQTAGKGQVITTYANLSENDALDRREWDAIVYDESHKLASNQAGKNTVYQDRHERLTMYSGAALQNRANSLLSEAERATRNRLLNKINAARGRDREEVLTKDEQGEWDRINEKIAQIAQDLSTKTKPKVVFLSATPFAYHQNLDYADKLLFDYEQDYTPTFGYNAPSARQAFFIRHFGYRMRTGKLTEPDVNVDVDLMERRFHEWLKKTGAVSGRKLETDQDYSREFVEIENSVGKAIDRGIDIINGYHEDGRDGDQRKFPALSARLQANLDFLAKSRLLEAIKAESAAKRARQHIALGRKVVIFHDYIEGNNQHPFRFPNISEDHVSQQILKREIDRFNREFPELVNLDLGKLSTVIGAFQREFGDQAKFFNGRETKKNRARAIAEFNRDDNATQILVVQRDAGKEGISLHDVTGKRPRALIDLGLPTAPTEAIQTEGRIYRYGQKSNAVIEYLKSNTKFEEHMFARRVASRARTAENLALGDTARNMENAFVDAYLNSSNDAPSDKQGTGNTAADARIQNDVPFDTARSLYFGQRKRTSRDKSLEGVDYFATPEPLGLKMVEWADASTGDSMLEPSAGHGAIARWFPEDTRNTFVEPSRELSVQLGLSARNGKILDHDFESLHAANKYDAIVMNPPFGSGGATAIAHLGKAFGHLKNGGRIVVLYPEGPAADKRMSAFLEKTDNLYTVAEFGLPPVVFERAGTTAKTRVLVLEKQLNADDAPNGQGRIDLNADTIGEFFDKIRDLSVKPRNKPTKTAESEPETAPITPAARGTVNDLLARSDESWLTARGDGVRRLLSKDGIKAAIDHLVPELAQEDSAVAEAFVRMGRSSAGLVPSRETNRLLSLGMAIPNHLRKMNLTGKGLEAFDRYASISGALRDALDAKYRDSTAAPVTAPSDRDAVGFTLNRTTHAKKSLEAGQPVPWFSVSMDRKVSSAAYTALAAQAKKLGGYWSSYRGQGAIPGFQFSSEQAAADFIAAASTGNAYSMPSGRGGATPAQTRADLSRALGADVVARLEQSGRLVIHDKPPTGAAAGAQGWVDQKGVIHLVPANLESSALSVVLHESAHLMRDDRFSPESRALGRAAHAVLRMSGLQGLIGNPSYNDLIQNVYRLAAEGNKTAQAALAKATVEPGNTAEEALSYIVEYADEKLPIYRRIISAIRAALYRLGIKVNLTPADLRALALSALKSRAKEVTARNAQPTFSLPDSTEAEAEQDQLWREFQAVRAQFQERQASQSAFERWFGQGVEGVNVHKGKPLTLFHGTNNPEFNRWDESLSGQASRHPTAGLGFFMTADARSAARYGSRLLELNAKINKPYFMTDADLTSIEDTQDAARFRRKLQAQGYDAAVIVAPGAAPYVVALQSNQVKLTSNTNPTESEDFRYSRPGRPPNLNSPRVAARVMDDIGGVMNDLKPGEKPLAKANPRNFAQMLTDLKANTRPQWLGLLTRNMQLELAREVLPRPMVEQFENAAEAMDAAESKMIQREAFPLADRWQALIRKHREQADRLARSLYMATWTGTDPRQPMPTKKRAEWIRTKAAYDGLTDPEAKKLFSEVLGFYQGQTERLFKELQNRIDRHSLPAADKLAAKDMLRQEFERMKDDGPYVPLMRFGDLTVFAEARKEGEKPVFATFETVQDQRAFADWLKNEGYQPQLGVKTEEVSKRALPQGDFVGRLAGIIDKTTQGPEGQVLKDAMYQLFLRSLPEQAIRKHFIHRRFVPGYTADALRTFATFGRRSAKQIARLAHSDRMSDALEAMAKANRDGQTQEPVSAGHLINELEKSFQWAMNPGTNALSSRLTHLGFLWHLGASPAHLFLNLSQQAQVTFPWLAGEMHGKIGSGSVAAALAKANKDFIASNPFTSADKRGAAAKKRRADLEGEFNGDMGRALKALEESGKTDKTQTYSLSGLSEEDSWLWSKPYLRKFTEGAAWFFHVAEVINREASAIAAYRLARRAGMSHDQGYDLARRAINETHFDYSPSNRARFMRGNVAKVLTLFKQYSLNISWQLGRNAYLWARGGSKAEKAQARTKLLGMLGMTMVMAGAAGMPFYGEIMWMLTQLLNATRDDDEPEWDADTEFRSLLDRAFGETGDEAVRHGLINAFMGIDVSSRIKLDDLWWRPIGDDADGKNMAYQMMEQALGPVAGLFVRGVATADGLMESLVAGDNARGASWRAIEGSLPKALKDISRSIRYAEEGATTFQGATLLPADRISALAKLGQAMGFVPAELAERYSENRAMKSLERRILTRRRALLDTVAMGLLNQDDEVVRAASEDIAAFNRRYPTVAITGDTISKSLRGRLRAKIETEAAGGARLDKRLAGMLLEGMR